MNQNSFTLILRVEEVRRLSSHEVKVLARGPVGTRQVFRFAMDTFTIDTPKVNDDILVTITTPAPAYSWDKDGNA